MMTRIFLSTDWPLSATIHTENHAGGPGLLKREEDTFSDVAVSFFDVRFPR